MKKLLCLLLFPAVLAGCSKDEEYKPDIYEDSSAPPLAASKTVWVFGNQTWSDAIQCPECDKETFENSDTEPQCRSHTEDGKTYYYYNWPYVNQNVATLCPDHWRVPTRGDFEVLVNNTTDNTLINAWGYGGSTSDDGSSMYRMGSTAFYWSSTELEHDSNGAYNLCYESGNLFAGGDPKYYGSQVRCVR